MSQLIIDPALSGQLIKVSEPVTLCDTSGRVLGRFIPVINWDDWIPLGPDVSEEELDRREKSNEKRYSTAEVLAHLEKL